MKTNVFISYSHKDTERVLAFVNQITCPQVEIWMDEKSLAAGQRYATGIFEGLRRSNFYLLFLSQASLSSDWVNAELDYAIAEEVERSDLRIVPVLLDRTPLPAAIAHHNCLDATRSLSFAAEKFFSEISKEGKREEGMHISALSFDVSASTTVEIVPLSYQFSKEDLEKDTLRVEKELMGRMQGLLMNFVPISSFIFEDESFRFKNGAVNRFIEETSGTFDGGQRKRVTVRGTVFSPEKRRVERFVEERLEKFSFQAMSFSISDPSMHTDDFSSFVEGCYEKLQDRYAILSYDAENGARFEYEKGLYIQVKPEENALKIRFTTEFYSHLGEKMKGFKLYSFAQWLMS